MTCNDVESIVNGKYKYGVTVCGKTNCVVLLPDDWEWSQNGVGDEWQENANSEIEYSEETDVKWSTMEAAGAVCLSTVGYRNGFSVNNNGSYGYYWSSTTGLSSNEAYSVELNKDKDGVFYFNLDRFMGCSVRLVTDASAAPAPAAIKGTAKATIGGSEVDVNWVQLWENGPKFAEYNVGVTDGNAESYGGYYTWGGTYNNDPNLPGYSWTDDHNISHLTDYDALTSTEDTATKLWGSNWRMPTFYELGEWDNAESKYVDGLLGKCNVEWIDGTNKKYKDTNIKGFLCTGKTEPYTSNSVFLPAAGYYNGNQSFVGYYWSSTPYGSDNACLLYFQSSGQNVANNARDVGFSVRAVLNEK